MPRIAHGPWRPALAALLAATGCNLDLPPGCADVLVARDEPAECETPDRCDQVLDEDRYVARWTLQIEAEGDDETVRDRLRCVADYLDNRGVTLVDRGSLESPQVVAEGIERNFRAVLDFAPITSYALSCSGDSCEHCPELDAIICSTDAFCEVLDEPPYCG